MKALQDGHRFTPHRQAVIVHTRLYHVDLIWYARRRGHLPRHLHLALDEERGLVSAGR